MVAAELGGEARERPVGGAQQLARRGLPGESAHHGDRREHLARRGAGIADGAGSEFREQGLRDPRSGGKRDEQDPLLADIGAQSPDVAVGAPPGRIRLHGLWRSTRVPAESLCGPSSRVPILTCRGGRLPGTDRDVQCAPAEGESGRLQAGLDVGDRRVPISEHHRDQALRAQSRPRALAVREPGQGQCGRRLLEHGRATRRMRHPRQRHELAPAGAARRDRNPGPFRIQAPRTGGPAGEDLRLGAIRGVGEHDLVRQVLQHDRRAEGPRGLVHHDLDRSAAQAQPGEQLVQPLPLLQRLDLAGDDAPMHLFGDRDELHLAVQGHQREVAAAARRDEGRRHDGEPGAQLQHDPGEPRVGQLVDEPGERLRGTRPAGARREQQLPAVEQRGDALAVGDVHPAHRHVDGSGQHLGDPGLQRCDLEGVRDGGETGLALRLAARAQGPRHAVRTICPIRGEVQTICRHGSILSAVSMGGQARGRLRSECPNPDPHRAGLTRHPRPQDPDPRSTA